MQAQGYAYQLRTLRAAERAQNKDYTDQAMVVLGLRIQTIDAGPESEEVKERLRERARVQWSTFMQRDLPVAQEPEPGQ